MQKKKKNTILVLVPDVLYVTVPSVLEQKTGIPHFDILENHDARLWGGLINFSGCGASSLLNITHADPITHGRSAV